jgi:hypothetical protein
MKISEDKGLESIFDLQVGVKIQVQQEIEDSKGKYYDYSNPPFVIAYHNFDNIIKTIESGRKFRVIE